MPMHKPGEGLNNTGAMNINNTDGYTYNFGEAIAEREASVREPTQDNTQEPQTADLNNNGTALYGAQQSFASHVIVGANGAYSNQHSPAKTPNYTVTVQQPEEEHSRMQQQEEHSDASAKDSAKDEFSGAVEAEDSKREEEREAAAEVSLNGLQGD